MVERYAREEMASKWTQEARYAAWLEKSSSKSVEQTRINSR